MSFDYKKELIDYPAPDYWKAGLIYYIEKNKLSVKSKKDFNKVIDEFNNLKLGD